jgi:hypothetical protein
MRERKIAAAQMHLKVVENIQSNSSRRGTCPRRAPISKAFKKSLSSDAARLYDALRGCF